MLLFTPPLSFGLFTATLPTTTVDKFNVPELGVQAQEGFWSATVDAYHHGNQLTGKKENNRQICVITFSQSSIRMCGQMFIEAGWHQRPTSCCSRLLRRSLDAGTITPFLQPQACAQWRAAPDPEGVGIEKLRRGKSLICDLVQAMIYESVHSPQGPEHTGSFDLWPYAWIALMMDKQRGDWFHQSSSEKLSLAFPSKAESVQ